MSNITFIWSVCGGITLFSIAVAALSVRWARKEIAHSRNVVALNRRLADAANLRYWPDQSSGVTRWGLQAREMAASEYDALGRDGLDV